MRYDDNPWTILRFALYLPLWLAASTIAVGCGGTTLTDAPSSDERGGGEETETNVNEPAEAPELDEEEERELADELDSVRADNGKADSAGFGRYKSSYENMVVAGETSGGTFALIAGTHREDFPFDGDRPWDNGLLHLEGDGYHFTHRTLGRALELDIDVDAERSTGRISYDGTMKRASDGREVRVRIDIPVEATRHRSYQLGRPYDFLGGSIAEKFAGMRWEPFELKASEGRIEVGEQKSGTVEGMHGEIEHGELVNFVPDRFAFAYDYVSLASPGSSGYSFLDFTAEPLDGGGVLGWVLSEYMARFASATLTLDDGLHPENIHGVQRPPQRDETVVLFENTVELELATLRRQMVETTDARGRTLLGLREIFEPK